MFKKFLIFINFVIVINVTINCKNTVSPPQKEKEFITVTYKTDGLLNENYQLKDSTILGIEMWAATYFPNNNKTNLITHTFQKYEYKKGFYIKVDSVYSGCERQLAVLICRHKPYPGNPISTNWKVYVMKSDTVLNIADSLVIFHWPQDTLRVIDKYWLRPW